MVRIGATWAAFLRLRGSVETASVKPELRSSSGADAASPREVTIFGTITDQSFPPDRRREPSISDLATPRRQGATIDSGAANVQKATLDCPWERTPVRLPTVIGYADVNGYFLNGLTGFRIGWGGLAAGERPHHLSAH